MSILRKLAHDLEVPINDIRRVCGGACYRYKEYTIPKRSGGVRQIAQPTQSVKIAQRALVRVLEQELPVHEAAKAYKKGVGIKENAKAHAGNEILLKLDFKEFFPSIRPNDFRSHYLKYVGQEIDSNEKEYIDHLIFWAPKNRLPLRLSIGAPSSPFISNTVLFDLDEKIMAFAARLGVDYTRYADDITISGPSIEAVSDAKSKVTEALSQITYPSLTLNTKKTTIVTKRYRRVVTGLILTNDGEVSLGREQKRKLRAMLHYYQTGQLSSDEISQARGWISFASDVEPEFIERMKKKYGYSLISTLLGSQNG